MQHVSRRGFLRRVGLGVTATSALYLLAACQASPASQPAAPAAAAPSSSTPTLDATAPAQTSAAVATTVASGASPKRGGTLVMAQGADPNPVPGNIDGSAGTVLSGLVYQGLIYVDKDRNIKPQLAESWDASPDGTSFTFHLRNGVPWQDGQPFSAADVVFTYSEITPKYVATASSAFKSILQKIEALDASTVKLTLARGYGPFLSFLGV